MHTSMPLAALNLAPDVRRGDAAAIIKLDGAAEPHAGRSITSNCDSASSRIVMPRVGLL